MADWLNYLLLFAAGCMAGTLNVIAGGGSFLTLPVLIFLGLPPTVANATNRVGVFVQNAGAVWGFHRHRVLDWRYARRVTLPVILGAALGTWLALWVSDEFFKKTLAFLMVVITLWTLRDPLKGKPVRPVGAPAARHTMLLSAGFFLVGVYSGFVQAGIGFFILAVTTLTGFDLVRGNAVKVFTVLTASVVSLAIFGWQAKIDWLVGLTLAAGTLLGGQLGVKLAVWKGHGWIRGMVTAAVLFFAVKLWLES